jgi:hypothetical protein
MNHLYLELGRAIAGQCPPAFREARLTAAPDEGRVHLACTLADGGEARPALDEVARHAILGPLDAVREAMLAREGKDWRSCTVTLVAGGGFKMEVAD